MTADNYMTGKIQITKGCKLHHKPVDGRENKAIILDLFLF